MVKLCTRALALSVLSTLLVCSGCGNGGGSSGSATGNPGDLDAQDVAPVIQSFSPPSETTVAPGDQATFSVDTQETEGVFYSWSINNVMVPMSDSRLVYQTKPDESAVHTISVQVIGSNSLTTTLVWTLTVQSEAVNNPPVVSGFVPTDNVSVTQGLDVAFSITASDQDAGDVVSYAWFLNGQDQGSNTPSLLLYTGDLPPGNHLVEVKADDGNHAVEDLAWHSWQLMVTQDAPVNHAPVIDSVAPNGSPTVQAGSSLTCSVDASDEDGDFLTYGWLLDGAAQSETSSTFSFSPDESQVGAHSVQVTVLDGVPNDDGTDPSFLWSVNVETSTPAPPPPPPPPSNDSPVIHSAAPSGDQTLQSGNTLSCSVSASDPDGDALDYLWLVDDVMQSETGSTFSFSPGDAQVGMRDVMVVVDDGVNNGNDPSHVWTVTVELPPPPPPPPPTDEPPMIDSVTPTGSQTVQSGNTLTFTVNASDPNGDSFEIRWFVDNVLQSESGSTFFYSPDDADAGSHTVTVEVDDVQDNMAPASHSWNVTVQLPPPPPPPPPSSWTVTWDAVDTDVNDQAETVVAYRVYIAFDPDSFDVPTSVVTTNEVEFSNLQSGVTYYVTITAVDDSDNESAFSELISIQVP